LATAVQCDLGLKRALVIPEFVLGLPRASTYAAVAAAIKYTGHPQLLVLYKLGQGHAVIAYRTRCGEISIADPGAPGLENKVLPMAGVKVYQDYIGCFTGGITALADWKSVGDRFAEFEAGKLGKAGFPEYRLKVVDDHAYSHPAEGVPVVFGASIAITIESNRPAEITVYDSDLNRQDSASVPLRIGENQLGVLVYAQPEPELLARLGLSQKNKGKLWAGFERITIRREAAPDADKGGRWIVKVTPIVERGPGFETTAAVVQIRNASGQEVYVDNAEEFHGDVDPELAARRRQQNTRGPYRLGLERAVKTPLCEIEWKHVPTRFSSWPRQPKDDGDIIYLPPAGAREVSYSVDRDFLALHDWRVYLLNPAGVRIDQFLLKSSTLPEVRGATNR
jgi:hypothetical protein